MFALGLVFTCIVFGSVGQILMKQGMNEIGKLGSLGELLSPSTLARIFLNPYVLAGVLFYAVSLIFWLGALSQLEVSFMYPLLSVGYILTAIFAFAFLGENITLARWSGIALVVLGSYLIISKI